MYKDLMKVIAALMVCVLILISLYLIVELLYSQGIGLRLGFGRIHEWGISEGMEVKAIIGSVALLLGVVAFICECIERGKSRRATKEPPESEKE